MTELFAESVDLMVVGMGTVLAFLGLLVVGTKLMSKLIITYFPEAEAPKTFAPSAKIAKTANAAANDQQLIAVISEAIKQHRNKPKK